MKKNEGQLFIERLKAKTLIMPNGCWEWQGALDGWGYGRVKVCGKNMGVHQVMYQLFKGPIPEGMELDHSCRNHRCINPDHLEPVTHQVNVQRGDGAKTLLQGGHLRTHCSKGHPYSYINARGHHVCRICKAEREKRYYRNSPTRRAKKGVEVAK